MPLKSKQARKPIVRPDWFPVTSYVHFDGQMSRVNAEKLVTNEDMVARHAFLPLITFTKVERRYRLSRTGGPIQVVKRRKLAYPSNRDACVFAYYSHLLTEPYERFLDLHRLGDVVIGYRKIGSNIELAMKAFADIKAQSHCVALAFDISNFFDRISHAQLKKGWQDVLGCERLCDHHFAVFKALTRFSTVDRRACLKRLGLPAAARDKDLKRPPLCSIDKYRDLIRGDAGGVSNLVVPWIRDHRVPQGTPLSAMAANISMLDFDLAVNSYVQKHGGFYRRYSDDILVVVPAAHRARVTAFVKQTLRSNAGGLRLNDTKTLQVEFVGGSLASLSKPLQYLGFVFDGENVLIRSSTLSRYWRRVHRTLRWAQRQQAKALADKIGGRDVIHRRELHARLTHLGKDTFVSGYAKRAAETLASKAIKRQVKRHLLKIERLLDTPPYRR